MKFQMPFLKQPYPTYSLSTPFIGRGKFLLLLVFVEVLMANFMHVHGQQVKTIDVFSVKDQRLSEVMRKLSAESNMNFTYDAQDPLMEMLITYQASNKTALAILSDLLKDTKRNYKQIGNQIVIYQDDSNGETIPSPSPLPKNTDPELLVTKSPVISHVEQPVRTDATIIRYDTIFVSDTVVLIDTLRLVDTVYLSNKSAMSAIKKMPVLSVDYFADHPYRKPGWAVGLSLTPLISNFNTIAKNNEWSLRSFAFDAQLIRQQKRWTFAAGIQLSHFAQKFNQSYEITSGGYFQIDTLDMYYTVIESDTNWIAVTDSTYLPLESEVYSYDKMNRIGYISFTAEVEYMFAHRAVFDLRAKAGLVLSSLIYRDGILLEDDNPTPGIEYGDLSFSSPVLGMLIGISSRFRLSDQFDLSMDASYRHYLDSVILRDDFGQQLSAYGLSVGIIYSFK
jgi:hypothetical protein